MIFVFWVVFCEGTIRLQPHPPPREFAKIRELDPAKLRHQSWWDELVMGPGVCLGVSWDPNGTAKPAGPIVGARHVAHPDHTFFLSEKNVPNLEHNFLEHFCSKK